MPYQVIARKWRPKKFDDVVGQRGVTQTLRNAIESERIAQAFIFAGPRGVGKTTTARILARALNCVKGPVPDPCGKCDPCLEIAEGRDLDVHELDGATHTGIDNVREVIIEGLAMMPARDRYKVFLIDEFHQLSKSSFNALLKSIEEPPPYVVFMMATTELEKVPDTVLSRSQVFEFRSIGASEIADQLHRIAKVEKINIDASALALLSRSAEGSMRDAQTALDQVLAFGGEHITAEDVSTVLGLVGRDLLLDTIEAVADERAADLFQLSGQFVEAGYDLRQVCRELSRVCRDLLVLAIDVSRFEDPEIAPEGDRDRLRALVQRFSREDLMRAFDVLSRAEADLRRSSQPRYHLEMALLRWIHLRHLVPLAEVIEGLKSDTPIKRSGDSDPPPRAPLSGGSAPAMRPRSSAKSQVKAVPRRVAQAKTKPVKAESPPTGRAADTLSNGDEEDLKSACMAELQRSKKVLYGTVIAQARRIVWDGDRITFTFGTNQKTLQDQLKDQCSWVEKTASQVAGKKIRVVVEQENVDEPVSTSPSAANESRKAEVMDDPIVQAMLDVLPGEIRDIEKA
ncbi:MAG: DNA polymerase III subunit gamma/tau [Acidobacteriota bacterium]|nr:DNA polymerase III subunit gamma/tau [Acidobacteriota bacterium]